jgi:mono/diheme cytochrome c family protein
MFLCRRIFEILNIVRPKAQRYTLICTGIHKQMREDMINKIQRAVLFVLVMGLVVACGTAVAPIYDESDAVATKVIIVPTKRIIEPTMTSLPPTATPTDEPTMTPVPPTPTDEPTAVPTEVPQVPAGDADNGKVLFNEISSVTGFSCAICHNVDIDAPIIGPTMLNIKDVAGSRVEGETAEEYLYNSILNPNDYIVDGFGPSIMPLTWGDVYSEDEINDIVAYLMTLEG